MKTVYLIAVLVALSVGAGAVSAQYSWIGNDGRKVYSDQPPPRDIEDKQVLKRPTAPVASKNTEPDSAGTKAGAGTAAKPASEKELAEKLKQADDAEAGRKKAEQERVARVKGDNCARAQQARTTYNSGVPLVRVNARGEREVMDDASRLAETQRLDSIITADCL